MARRPPSQPRVPAEPLAPRHREILHAVMVLVAERGYAGASMRELARRVGMSQPSLYHYCRSKEDLVEQAILRRGLETLVAPAVERGLPTSLEQLPRFLTTHILSIYDDPDYRLFIRFMFAVCAHQPRYREALRHIYEDSFERFIPGVMAPFIARGEITQEDARALVRVLVNSVGLLALERRVVFGEASHREDTRELAAWVSQVAEHLLQGVLRRRAEIRKVALRGGPRRD